MKRFALENNWDSSANKFVSRTENINITTTTENPLKMFKGGKSILRDNQKFKIPKKLSPKKTLLPKYTETS